MLKRLLPFLALPLLALNGSLAAEEGPDLESIRFAHNEAVRCRTSEDPFEIPAFVYGTHGPMRDMYRFYPPGANPTDLNKCIDHTRFRAAIKLTNSERRQYGFADQSGRLIYANIRHLKNWYVASIPVDSVSHMIFHIEYYTFPLVGTRGGHSQIRVFFREPVKLTPQFPRNPRETLETNSLIFSAQGAAIRGVHLEPMRSMDGSMLLALMAYTQEARLMEQFSALSAGTTVHQYPLDLPSLAIKNYIETYLAEGNRSRMSQQFMLFKNNCNTTQFRVLDQVLASHYSPEITSKLNEVDVCDPNNALKALTNRGLTSPSLRMINFEDEPASKAFMERMNNQ